MNKKYFSLATTILITILLFVLVGLVKAGINPPDFPSCTSKIFSVDGDWAHWDLGLHGIPGVGSFEGSDDVYSLTSGNFLQCFCSVDKTKGIQTLWWNVERAGLTEEEINGLIADGWILENGSGWNLFNEKYLVKNGDFSCLEPTPTPTCTPTLTPTLTPTPTPTSTPTPTPTPGEEPESRCVALSASPVDGTAPLTVKFTASGYDEDGDIKRYKFDFGDASGGQPQVWEQDGSEAAHRYENPGVYTVGLHVQDSRGNWRNGGGDCKKTITVTEKPQVLGTKTPTVLPKTGISALIGLGVIVLGFLGRYLYRRFRLV